MTPNRYANKPPLYGMVMVFAAIAIVAVTAYLNVGWWSIPGYVVAAVIAVVGMVLVFRDPS